MRRRAEAVDATRRRITEAAVRLHTTIGPSRTTMSAVAEEAGVTRLTLHRHFPDAARLFAACSFHWAMLHPGPDPAVWRGIADPAERAETALRELFAFYRANAADLGPIVRDMAWMPPEVIDAIAAEETAMVDALVVGTPARGRTRRRLRAALAHFVRFETWQSLVEEPELTDEEGLALATGMLRPLLRADATKRH